MTDTPLATVQQYIHAFNDGDVTGMAEVFAEPGWILDGMAPHVWQGPTAARDWYHDVLVEGELHGAAGYSVALGEPLHDDVTGDSAYVVVPTTMTFAINGNPVTQPVRTSPWHFARLPRGGGSRPGPGRRASNDPLAARLSDAG